ncbi:hypothetical protein pb186bvf_020650 [Paramecium bursaria]
MLTYKARIIKEQNDLKELKDPNINFSMYSQIWYTYLLDQKEKLFSNGIFKLFTGYNKCITFQNLSLMLRFSDEKEEFLQNTFTKLALLALEIRQKKQVLICVFAHSSNNLSNEQLLNDLLSALLKELEGEVLIKKRSHPGLIQEKQFLLNRMEEISDFLIQKQIGGGEIFYNSSQINCSTNITPQLQDNKALIVQGVIIEVKEDIFNFQIEYRVEKAMKTSDKKSSQYDYNQRQILKKKVGFSQNEQIYAFQGDQCRYNQLSNGSDIKNQALVAVIHKQQLVTTNHSIIENLAKLERNNIWSIRIYIDLDDFNEIY